MSHTSFASVLIIAIGLSADCFAVALSSSIIARHFTLSRFVRLPLAFGIFQALMIVIGWLAGRSIIDFVSSYDHWVAFGLLAVIGGRMVWEAFHEKDRKSVSSWLTILALSLATSIDALAVGLSFAFLKTDILIPTVTVGVTAFIITVIAQLIGNKVGSLVGKRAELVGGLILIGIGIKILLEHLL